MDDYENARQQYKPKHIKVLLIAESPPPSAQIQSSRHFYRTDQVRRDDRLFVGSMKALYPQTASLSETELERDKSAWLRRFQNDGWYMIETLEKSQPHGVTKLERQAKILDALPSLIVRMRKITEPDTKIILIKSNVFDVAAEPLRKAGFTVTNTGLIDYPGRFNQRAYREKLARLASEIK